MARDRFDSLDDERECLNFFQAICFGDVVRNNLSDKLAVDFIDRTTRVKIDFQKSTNFARYGDLRWDLSSSHRIQPQLLDRIMQARRDSTHRGPLEMLRSLTTVDNPGKSFKPGYCDLLVVFFYRGEVTKTPDYVGFFDTVRVNEWLVGAWRDLEIKLNDKHDLIDHWGSSFICIPVSRLHSEAPDSTFFQPYSYFVESYDGLQTSCHRSDQLLLCRT